MRLLNESTLCAWQKDQKGHWTWLLLSKWSMIHRFLDFVGARYRITGAENWLEWRPQYQSKTILLFFFQILLLHNKIIHFRSKIIFSFNFSFFHYGRPYHIETSPLICSASQWTGFYMIGISVMKELNSCC